MCFNEEKCNFGGNYQDLIVKATPIIEEDQRYDATVISVKYLKSGLSDPSESEEDISDEEMPSLEFVNKIPFLAPTDNKNDIKTTKVRSRFLSPKNIKERTIEKEYAVYREVIQKEMSSKSNRRNIEYDNCHSSEIQGIQKREFFKFLTFS